MYKSQCFYKKDIKKGLKSGVFKNPDYKIVINL